MSNLFSFQKVSLNVLVNWWHPLCLAKRSIMA